jgi:hypothetical protein
VQHTNPETLLIGRSACTGAAPTHPRWPEMTRYIRHGACHTGLGHLLGSRRAIAAEGVYSFCTISASTGNAHGRHSAWCVQL